ncbi:MAG: hypothetical protein KGI42_04215 [Xanthomonadaceae bacterium]|nr:hypothetical protein [Xanthomonadaceae bacterium]
MNPLLLFAAALLAAGAAYAQTAPTAPSDAWSRPAPASTATYDDAHPLKPEPDAASPFKFKARRSARPLRNDAMEAAGKSPVMGGNQIGRDGRPTVNCAATPMDPSCR